MSTFSMRKSHIFIYILIFLGILIYTNSFYSPLIWDDLSLVNNNTFLRSWKYLPRIFTSHIYAGQDYPSNFYRPLQNVTYLIDYTIWNPETDKFIAKNFSVKDISGKSEDKGDLQKICNLPMKKDVPLFGIVSRLAEQKGFDIIAQDIEKICKMGLQLVILGTGDLKYHLLLEDMVKKYPKAISLHLKFDDALAHKIYAGSDIFLMPSKYEPCGLGQMISLRYGTIPLVFKTGGLADTVNKDNGFVFSKYNKCELLKTIEAAVRAFKDKSAWQKQILRAMQCNFSWQASAKEYIRLYEKIGYK